MTTTTITFTVPAGTNNLTASASAAPVVREALDQTPSVSYTERTRWLSGKTVFTITCSQAWTLSVSPR